MPSFGTFVVLFMWLLAVGLPSVVLAFRAYRASRLQRAALLVACALLLTVGWAIYTDPDVPTPGDAVAWFMVAWGVLLYLGGLIVAAAITCLWCFRSIRREA